MHFCIKCGNMYYIKIDDNEELTYNCRKCGHKNSDLINELDNLCVSKTELNKNSNVDYSTIINQYTKLDPTLPRINSIKCPNQECICNKDETVENEVIYIRYNDEDMKYVYTCAKCDFIWTAQPI